MKILDPNGKFLQKWNKIMLLLCVIALYTDPLFLYIPFVDEANKCIGYDRKVEMIAIVLRSIPDAFYIFHMFLQFRTGFYSRTSILYGKGVLIKNPRKIRVRYMCSTFLLDFYCVFPFTQFAILVSIPMMDRQMPTRNKLEAFNYKMFSAMMLNRKKVLEYTVLLQYIPRVLRVIPLSATVTKTSGILTKKAWAGAAFNLLLYMLASHVLGSLYYWFSIEREMTCWRKACGNREGCVISFEKCHNVSQFANYLKDSCPIQTPNPTIFDYGIFLKALQSGVLESNSFPQKIVYFFWWGLQNLSSLGQNLETSTYIWEMCFAVCILIAGLLLFAFLISNLQTHLQSNTLRLEEVRVKRLHSDQWMSRRLLPKDLKEKILRYEEYKWQETQWVDEETLIKDFPTHLQKQIKRHLCIDLLTQVTMFQIMDDCLLDATCLRLKLVLLTEDSFIIQEGDHVDEMFFVMTGTLHSSTTNSVRTDYFKDLRPGNFCGEELLSWALDPHSSTNPPLSTRTVTSTSQVEAFTLPADALKYIASQFRKLHSRHVHHIYRYHSQPWRRWAVFTIELARRRYLRRKLGESLREVENRLPDVLTKKDESLWSLSAATSTSESSMNHFRSMGKNGSLRQKGATSPMNPERLLSLMIPQKPSDPDFTAFYD